MSTPVWVGVQHLAYTGEPNALCGQRVDRPPVPHGTPVCAACVQVLIDRHVDIPARLR